MVTSSVHFQPAVLLCVLLITSSGESVLKSNRNPSKNLLLISCTIILLLISCLLDTRPGTAPLPTTRENMDCLEGLGTGCTSPGAGSEEEEVVGKDDSWGFSVSEEPTLSTSKDTDSDQGCTELEPVLTRSEGLAFVCCEAELPPCLLTRSAREGEEEAITADESE